MPRFPQTEAEIIDLAHAMMTGLSNHPDDFPEPPIKPEELTSKLNDFLVARDDSITKHAAAVESSSVKKNTLEILTDAMKHEIQYAERLKIKEKLLLIGWSAQADSVPSQAPGQVRNLIAIGRGDDWLTLKWDAPAEGGKPLVYHVQSRELSDGIWTLTATAFTTETTLSNLTRSKTIEYRIEAANKQGAGAVSNSLAVSF